MGNQRGSSDHSQDRGYALDESKQFERALKDPAKMLDLIKHYAETNLVLAQENQPMQLKV